MSDRKNANGLTFEQWFLKADAACEELCGKSLHDLPWAPDALDEWADNEPPDEFAEDEVRRSGNLPKT